MISHFFVRAIRVHVYRTINLWHFKVKIYVVEKSFYLIGFRAARVNNAKCSSPLKRQRRALLARNSIKYTLNIYLNIIGRRGCDDKYIYIRLKIK